MKFEHFALNVTDARAAAKWYADHIGLRVARSREDMPYTSFLSDDTGRVIVEFYSNPAAVVPDYSSIHPLCFHIAFVAEDPKAAKARLLAAGASEAYDEGLADGTILLMLRDPWGVPLQIVKRPKPL
jgi:catechol 2,3-dioxygenase-like lactoylglutathione lyase family enzyme